MFAEVLLASSLQIGPFWRHGEGGAALCPLWSKAVDVPAERSAEADTTDILWPVFTSHRDWWRFCWFMHRQEQIDGGWQFNVIPLWFCGNDPGKGPYWGLFPLWGGHPHVLMMYDWRFAAWPLWMQYRTPRPSRPFGDDPWMTSNVVLFPFFHWRDDGSWGLWPVCGTGHRRESDHFYALWPVATWASYRADRDTAGAGRSWMLWPLFGSVERERERQSLFLPPFFSLAETPHGRRVRCPWPLFEMESTAERDRLSVFPLFERTRLRSYATGRPQSEVTRFGWRLVELYRGPEGELEESRVFPLWTKGRGFFRLWPFWSSTPVDRRGEVVRSRCLELFPVKWVDAVDRNWAPYWTFYESEKNPVCTSHSLFWGIFKWRTFGR